MTAPLCSALVRPHAAGLCIRKAVEKMEGAQRQWTQLIKGLERKLYKERLREPSMFSLEKK